MHTRIKSLIKSIIVILIGMILLPGCAIVVTHPYESYSSVIKPSYSTHNGKFIVFVTDEDSTIEEIDETHYKACYGYKWPGLTVALLPIPIPIPLRIPTGKNCNNYEINNAGQISYTRTTDGSLYCCGFCPQKLRFNGQFFGCGKTEY